MKVLHEMGSRKIKRDEEQNDRRRTKHLDYLEHQRIFQIYRKALPQRAMLFFDEKMVDRIKYG
jgi:hypothetical protein